MLSTAGGDASHILPLSDGGHEDTGCSVSHDLQKGEPIGWGWGEWVWLEIECSLPAIGQEFWNYLFKIISTYKD